MPPAQRRRPSDASSRHRRLLLLACSDGRRSGGRLTAADPCGAFGLPACYHLVIRIVSAKYGLLRPEDKIANSATHGDDLRPSHHPERYDDNPTALTPCAGVPEA